ncbi:MAG: hypothetical protein NUV65_02700 [Candidatus Roizmanbacteria bacterium]|nr:hypothetical protein [Candidatus Roizmanbacteria bacterium]
MSADSKFQIHTPFDFKSNVLAQKERVALFTTPYSTDKPYTWGHYHEKPFFLVCKTLYQCLEFVGKSDYAADQFQDWLIRNQKGDVRSAVEKDMRAEQKPVHPVFRFNHNEMFRFTAKNNIFARIFGSVQDIPEDGTVIPIGASNLTARSLSAMLPGEYGQQSLGAGVVIATNRAQQGFGDNSYVFVDFSLFRHGMDAFAAMQNAVRAIEFNPHACLTKKEEQVLLSLGSPNTKYNFSL